MAGLTGKTIASNYKSLLRIDDDANGVDTGIENVTDGEGTASALNLSDDSVRIYPRNDDGTSTFNVRTSGGSSLLTVDSTNSVVKANVGQDIVNTMYTTFHMSTVLSSGAEANNHYPLGYNFNKLITPLSFGTSTDPATTFTTSATTSTAAAILVPCLWYIPDNITIDSISAIEGADEATGDTTRMHLMSYAYASGSTSTLTSGVVVAHNSDVTNAGSEQTYKSTFTIGSSDVDAGKVIMAFFRSDSINSDYSVNIYIKYHLR